MQPRNERRRRGGYASRTGLFAFLMGTSGTLLGAQATSSGDVWSWVDAYYADYSAMSGAPTGAAMDRWLAHYAPFVFFEDPTLGQSAIGTDTMRQVYAAAFTGPLGPVRWDIVRRVASRDWVAVEGWLEGTQNGKPFRTRFSTWLKIHDDRIARQIDYVDYAAMRRQVDGTDPVPDRLAVSPRAEGDRNGPRAFRIGDDFYRRYEALPVLASAGGIARYTDLLTQDFKLEDPTAQLLSDGRERHREMLSDLLANGEFGKLHWEIDRRVTDGEWVVVEGTWRGVYKGRPFGTRFTTWLRVRGDRIAHQIDYLDYTTFRRQTSPR